MGSDGNGGKADVNQGGEAGGPRREEEVGLGGEVMREKRGSSLTGDTFYKLFCYSILETI